MTLRATALAALFCAHAGGAAAAQPEGGAGDGFGGVVFLVEPPDAHIAVGHRTFEAANADVNVPGAAPEEEAVSGETAPRSGNTGGEPVAAPLPAGDHLAEISRRGYLTTFAGFTVDTGKDTTVEVQLRRSSATLRVRTVPGEATVLIDGFVHGRSGVGTADFASTEALAGTDRERRPSELWIADLPLGAHDLEIRKEGFRTHRQTVEIAALRDVELPTVVLQSRHAMLLLAGLPEDARVYGNGRELLPDREKIKPEAPVPPGPLDLVVARGVHDYFETSVVVEDGAWLEVPVELRPALAVVGVFGDDAAGLRAVASAVETLGGGDSHIVLDREQAAAAVFDEFGVDANVLRDTESARTDLDWEAIRGRIQDAAPAALYLAAVLSDDLVADTVDLWLWSAAPGPAAPDVATISIRDGRLDGAALRRLARSLYPAVAYEANTPGLGAVLIESLRGGALMVAAVDQGGPAAEAGLAPGMEVVGLNGEAARAVLQLTEALDDLPVGGAVEFTIRGADGDATLAVTPEWGLSQLDVHAPDLLPSTAAARLLREIERPGDVPRWLLVLDLAALLIAAGDADGAVRLLEEVEAPDRAGLGQGAARYALGLALSDLAERGREGARERARSVFESLAGLEHGRLASDRGPRVAPRARLRAAALADR